MTNFVKNNLKVIVAVIITALICISSTAYATTQIFASNISYDNTTSGLTSTDVQSAINELDTKADTWIDPSCINFETLNKNTKKTVLASSAGVCIKRNNKVSCFKTNNWSEEQNHIQQVFSDVSCDIDSTMVDCYASDFDCDVTSDGTVMCRDHSDYSGCYAYEAGSTSCN